MPPDTAPAQAVAPAQDDAPALMPHLRALRALLAVAEQRSTTAAAQAIHLSQPAITRAIRRLEAACALPLFERTTRGMQPTRQGLPLAQRAGLLLGHLKTGAREAMALDGSVHAAPHAADRFAHGISPSQIRALLAVAACGSESQAAARLGVSQPAVYAALQELGRLLSTGLFYKLPTGTRLTPPGEALLLRVKQAVAELRGMDADMALWHGQTRGRLVLGVLPLSAPIFLPRALQSLTARFPAVQVKIVDGAYESLMQQLLSADIDAIVGALRQASPPPEVQQRALFDDDLSIVAHREHPCFQRARLELADLLRWPWVAPLPHTPADRIWRGIFARGGLPAPEAQLCAGSPAMTLALVLQSGLLALASRGEVLLDAHGGALRIVPVELSQTTRSIGIATRASTVPPPDLRAFIECCREAALALGLPGARR